MPYNQLGFTSFFNYPHRAKQFLLHSLVSDNAPMAVDSFPQLFGILRGLQENMTGVSTGPL